MALWLIVFGAGLLLLGLPPRGVEVARGIAFLRRGHRLWRRVARGRRCCSR